MSAQNLTVESVDVDPDGERALVAIESADVSVVVEAPADLERDAIEEALEAVPGAVERYVPLLGEIRNGGDR